jgi:hypothetical protein
MARLQYRQAGRHKGRRRQSARYCDRAGHRKSAMCEGGRKKKRMSSILGGLKL